MARTQTQVEIETRPTFFNVRIFPHVKDVDQSEGLCGSLNENRDDDLMTRDGRLAATQCNRWFSWGSREINQFADSWRLSIILCYKL